MVQFGYDSDDNGLVQQLPAQKFKLYKPVCPYVCSTPLDFNAEREYLAENIFPKLHEVCRTRGSVFSPLDIQWEPDGLQTDSGHLLRICLDYITKCSPFFICLLGETYGPYRPQDSPKLPKKIENLSEDAPWLDKNYFVAASAGYSWVLKEMHQNCSVPELEIIQAAFLSDNRFCHFYYRQPEHLDALLKGLSPEEEESLLKIYKPENEYADLNIRDLKQRIVNKGLSVKYFKTKEELGQHVFEDWLAVINQLYPPLLQGSEFLETEEYREWVYHEVFAESRRHLLVTYPELRSQEEELSEFCSRVLDEPFLEPEEPVHRYRTYSITNMLRKQPEVAVKNKSVMVVKSDRGFGKSSLVANWVKQFDLDNPEVKVISHFVGSSGRSRDVATFMRRCIEELREEYLKEDTDMNPDPEEDAITFKELCGCFHAALSLGPCVLLLDGVNDLGGTIGLSPQAVKKFSWIPLPLPPQCRLVLTTSPSDYSYTCLSKRPDVQLMTVPSLKSTKLKMEILEEHMQTHFDNLSRSHLQTLFESKLSGRPHFLSVAGSEMSSFTVYTNLDNYVEMVREMCTSMRDFYTRCFRRWSQDYSWTYEVLSADQTDQDTIDFTGWVPDILRLIAVSRSGLTANELLEILERIGYQENVKVTQFDWLIFRKCLGANLTENSNGVFNFSHQQLKEVVEYILLRTIKPSTAEIISKSDFEKEWKKQKNEFHQYLVQYFAIATEGQRRSEELPWQQLMAGDMQALKRTVANPGIFLSLMDIDGKNPSNKEDLKLYWYHLQREGIDPSDVYEDLLIKLGVLTPVVTELEVKLTPTAIPSPEATSKDTDDTEDMVSSEEVVSSRPSPTQITLFTPTTPNIPTILATPASEHKLSDIDEVSENLSKYEDGDSKDQGVRVTDTVESVFITESRSQVEENALADLSLSMVVKVTWYVAEFLLQIGHVPMAEKILLALNEKLAQSYPLGEEDQLFHAKVQEHLGQLALDGTNSEVAEKWYKKSLRSIMDMYDLEEKSAYYMDIQNLKSKVIRQIGYLRMEEGLLEDADDLLQESLEISDTCSKIPTKATIHYYVGILRIRQEDYLMAETNLRNALLLREKWFGKSHPLVGDILFVLGQLMSDVYNDKGYDKMAAEDAFRRVLEIREHPLDKEHILVADTLFELGKLLKDETSLAARSECQRLLRRALDIKITQLGGEHIDTRAVRQYLSNLEVTLKASKHDVRTSERPYSSLSWRLNDITNLEKKSQRPRSGKSGKSSAGGQSSRPSSQISRAGSHYSRPASHLSSRPVSGLVDHGGFALGHPSNLAYLKPSERLLLETNKPRLLQRESVERKLKTKTTVSPTSLVSKSATDFNTTDDFKKHINVEIKTGDENEQENIGNEGLLDSFATETERPVVKFAKSAKIASDQRSPVDDGHIYERSVALRSELTEGQGQELRFVDQENPGRETPVEKLYKRYGSPKGEQSNSMSVGMAKTRHKRPMGSARSAGSSYTMASCYSGLSVDSHRSHCDIPAGPHSIHISNARTTTIGPHSSITSLMGDPGRRDISKGIHHKSAWYHVPGRYSTENKKVPTKRSQVREEALRLKKSMPSPGPDPYKTFMTSDYRKNNPLNIQPPPSAYARHGAHTCGRDPGHPMYPNYHRRDSKQYTVCDSCQKEAQEALQNGEVIRVIQEQQDVSIRPTVNRLIRPDRPKQTSFVVEEAVTQEEIEYTYPHSGTMVTFKESVEVN